MPKALREATLLDYPSVERFLSCLYGSATTTLQRAVTGQEPFQCFVSQGSLVPGAVLLTQGLVLASFETDPQDVRLLCEVDGLIRDAVKAASAARRNLFCNVHGRNRSIIAGCRLMGFVEDWSGYEYRHAGPLSTPSPAAEPRSPAPLTEELAFRGYEEAHADEYITLLLAVAPHLSEKETALAWLRGPAARDDLVAVWMEGRLAGVCVLDPDPASGEGYAIDSIVVEPALHGQGLGSALLQHCLDKVINGRGMAPVHLKTSLSNTTAHRLYERHGFVVSGCFSEHTYRPR